MYVEKNVLQTGGEREFRSSYIYLIFFVESNMTDWITVLAGGGNSEKYLLVLIIIYLDFRYVVWYAFKKLNAHAGRAKSFL